MRYIKKMDNFLNESTNNIYSNLDEVIDKDWTNIRVRSRLNTFELVFDVTDDERKFTKIIFFEKGDSEDDYFLADNSKEPFKEKLKKEFSKDPWKYSPNFEYDLKILGNLDQYREANKYNL